MKPLEPIFDYKPHILSNGENHYIDFFSISELQDYILMRDPDDKMINW